jgi:hypothetical protein
VCYSGFVAPTLGSSSIMVGRCAAPATKAEEKTLFEFFLQIMLEKARDQLFDEVDRTFTYPNMSCRVCVFV